MVYLILVVSLVILYFGAEWLVGGASSLAARLGISPLIIGLTIVSFGTSAPELLVSVKAAIQEQSALSVGNVIGSNLFNVVLILGISAIVYPLSVKKQLLRFDVPVMIAVSILFMFLFIDGLLSTMESWILILLFAAYISMLFVKSMKDKRSGANTADDEIQVRIYKHWLLDVLLIVIGLGGLIYGSSLLVDSAIKIAHTFGVSEAIIGLTIVAAGTSVPELATSVVAAIKKQSDIAIGNVVGSNISNLLLILGVAGAVYPIETRDINIIDNLFVVGTGIILWGFMKMGKNIKRWQGVMFVLMYVVYMGLKLSSI